MASFAEQIASFAAKAQGQVDSVVRGSVEEAGQRLIDRSPIDTGRFKSNWNYAAEQPDIFTSERTNIRTVNGIEDMPAKAAGHIHYVTNSLPYGPALERGHSKQAPQGMVGLTSLEWPQIVELVASKVAT